MAKVFQILVPDNTLVSRIISCENQVTELFVIDRADKKFVSEYSSDLNKPALYILANRNKKQLYVGETDDSIKRLKNHEAKDFWTEAIVFHSTTDTLSTTEVKWLEAKTYETLTELGYYDLSHNKVKPQFPPLKKNQLYTLEPIFEEAKNYICAAGFDFFLKGEKDKEPSTEDFIPCTMKRNSDAQGLFNPKDGTLIVLKGSKINPGFVDKADQTIRKKRLQDIALYAKKSGGELVVSQDVTFESPSGAAKFCCGGSANGWREWKNDKGEMLLVYRKENK